MSEEADFKVAGLSLWVLGYQFPSANDFWDGNWLNICARVEASGAVVEARGAILRTTDFESFLDQLAVLNSKLVGDAGLRSAYEVNLDVTIHYESLGHLTVTINITPDQMTQSHKFLFGIDQTYLKPAILGCKNILSRFPVKAHEHKNQG